MKPLLTQFSSSALQYKKYTTRAVPLGFICLATIASGVMAFREMDKHTHFWTPWFRVVSVHTITERKIEPRQRKSYEE
jgi:hypothetical protein